jgi:FixJ family two-component response regulator
MADAAGGRILVVDDDASVRRALLRLLRSYGYEVETFESAAELLASVATSGAFCLVTDIRMPGMGGVELCEQLHAAGRDLPTVFVTAHGTDGLRSLVLEGAPILQKPVAAEQLLAAIEAVTRKAARATRR